MPPPPHGTATPISSLISPSDVHAATLRLHSAIADQNQSLSRLHSFIADNAALAARVRRLPDDLSHQIIVPFGPAAFFPGKLIHTNEMTVLLGEGYYADRTAKQTAEILERRGEGMEAQVKGIQAIIQDLQAEASFFETTAAEAEEGLVEIMEEYIEEPQKSRSKVGVSHSSSPESSNIDDSEKSVEEYARIMARLDELEKAEAEEEEDDEEEEEDDEEEEEEEEEEEDNAEEDNVVEVKTSPGTDTNEEAEVASQGSIWGQYSALDKNLQFTTEGSYKSSHTEQKAPLPLKSKGSIHMLSDPKREESSQEAAGQTFTKGFDGRKAFTGSIIEHAHNLPPIQSAKTSIPDKPSESNIAKPVSRFKLQRGNR